MSGGANVLGPRTSDLGVLMSYNRTCSVFFFNSRDTSLKFLKFIFLLAHTGGPPLQGVIMFPPPPINNALAGVEWNHYFD